MPARRYILPRFISGPDPMRAETEKLVEEIKQSMSLLRRHL
jgi:hypothetical protein